MLKSLLSGHYEDFGTGSFFYKSRDNNSLLLLFLGAILFFKVIAMAVTNGSGGIGGIFAPALFTGGLTGFIYARLINLFPFIHISEHNFALVGMAGVMAGVMHAPLTSIFLIAEITGGYGLIIPLITTSAISFLTIKYFEPHSIYTSRLARRGELITHDKDKAAMSRLNIYKLLETNFSKITPDITLGNLVKVVSESKRNIFPVVDRDDNFLGVVSVNDIRNVIFNQDMYNKLYVRDLMTMPPIIIEADESMDIFADKVSKSIDYNIAVLKKGKYLGFVSKVKVFSSYRELLKSFSEE